MGGELGTSGAAWELRPFSNDKYKR